jgi:hypothetical protein
VTKIHNVVFLRILSIVILFSSIYNLVVLFDNFNVLNLVSNTIVPVLFVLIINRAHLRSSIGLLLPLTVYLIDRFFIYTMFVIDQLGKGAAVYGQSPILGILLQVNALRFIMTITLVIIVIYLIASKQKGWFYKLYYSFLVLLILQIIELILYYFNELSYTASSFIELMILIPSFIFFPIIMVFATRLHLFEIYTELGLPNEFNIKVQGTHVTPPQTPSPKQSSPQSPPKNNPPRSSQPSNQQSSPAPKTNKKCPACGTVNSTTFCQNCGQDLR